MNDILYDEVPSLDLADFTSGDPQRKRKFVEALGAAYTNIGFVAVKNHYLNDALSKQLYDVIQKFFSLPDAVKPLPLLVLRAGIERWLHQQTNPTPSNR
jgi:isopenicillin N synthase-like dioxygenase